VPGDADGVVTAVRLGWYMAEVRGRNRPGGPPGNPAPQPHLVDHALPSPGGGSPASARIEAQKVLATLAVKLGLDRSYRDTSYSETVEQMAKVLDVSRRSDNQPAVLATWQSLAAVIYEFDAHVRDTLATQSEAAATGYRLGVALAESYWALDPDSPDDSASPTSWVYMFGGQRSDEMQRLLGNLAAYVLYEGRPRNTRQAAGFFGPQLALVIVGLAALVAAIVWFGVGTGTNLVSAVLGILGIAGVSAGGLSARRSRPGTNQISGADVDQVAISVTIVPPLPRPADLRAMVRQRSID
jgi:hypothetical protein